jgi:hypothetical protein
MDFVGFVADLLNRPTDDATVSVRKSTSEKELLFVHLWLRKITVSIKFLCSCRIPCCDNFYQKRTFKELLMLILLR